MGCPHIPNLPYAEFSKKLQDDLGNRRLPLAGSVELTCRCNLQCRHCFLNLPATDRSAQEQELSQADWRRLIDEMVDEGCLWLLLTGGEPLLRPDFFEIYTYAKKKGLLITLFTNGTLITTAGADYLAAWRPFAVEISIYGKTRETHEAVTGVPGSYDKCLRAIHLLRERKINLTLKTMVLTLNRHELAEMKNWAEGLGATFRYDAILNPRVDGSRAPCAFRIPPEQVVALDLQDSKRLAGWKDFLRQFQDPPLDDSLFVCGAGLQSFHIDPFGRLSACMIARQPHFQLSQGSFKEGWGDFLLQVHRQKRQHESPCRRCGLLSWCDQCPGWSQIEHGNQEQVVEYLCRIAHLRAEAFGVARSTYPRRACHED